MSAPYASATQGEAMIFALGSSRDYGMRLCEAGGYVLAPHEERQFEDGEHKARPLVSVRDRDVYVVSSLYGEEGASGNDKLCRLLFFIGALKDAAAGRVTALVPYLAYARKDRKSKARDPVTTRYVAALFEAVGCDAIVTMDVHNLAAFQNAFRCRTEHLEAGGLICAHMATRLRGEQAVVVSPDAGGIKRAEAFRKRLTRATGNDVGSAFAEKYRSAGVVSGDMLAGDVIGRHAIIVDDLVSTGNTVMRVAANCKAHGATKVTVAATHGLFTSGTALLLNDAAIDGVVVTDTVVPAHAGGGRTDGLIRLSTAPVFAEAVRRLHGGGSITELVDAD